MTADHARLLAGCAALVDVATPTGFERPTADRVVELLTERGVEAYVDPLDDCSANAWGVIRGTASANAPRVLLYSPLDTVTTGNPNDDVPQSADRIEGHMLPAAVVDEDRVTGLGAQNPKGHAASILEAAAVLAASDTPLAGDVIVGFGAGGMPTHPLDGDSRETTGHGIGASHLLDTLADAGLSPDAAVIAKSGWFVQHEEVGLAWIDIVVAGAHTYVGARHRIPYRNAVADAARVVLLLEDHFATRPGEREDSTLAPQAMVGSLHAGWSRMAAFSPATAHLRCDVRLLPGQTPDSALDEVNAVLDELRASNEGFDATATINVHIAGTHTPSNHGICTAVRSAWEAIEGRPHPKVTGLSGSTDANILRAKGVPTARIGLPKVHIAGVELGFAEGMNTVDAASMSTLTDLLVRTVHNAQETC